MRSPGHRGGETTAPEVPAIAATEDLAEAPCPDGGDRYEILELVGRGGMGSVYRARDRSLGRLVALKFILGAHPSLALRLMQEARAQARIEHPHICRVYEVGEIDGRPYIAMQLVDGDDLGAVAAQLSLDEKVAILGEVARAIHEAHRLGIVHRDLKPANILVERTGDGRWFPVVTDFGLARELDSEAGLTESGAVLGTPAYMSPEQARGERAAVDRRSDVYSLGATLYELLCGRPPFPKAPLHLTLAYVLRDEPQAPRSLAPHLPADLEVIALKCLEKDPERRYASARALAEDLGRYTDGEPILARRASLLQRLHARARRDRALTAVTAGSLAIIGVLGVLGGRAWLASRHERAQAGARAELAASLGRDVEEMEWLFRAATLLPLHDTTPERDLIRARMQRIAAVHHDLGTLGDGAIHEALGRGHAALGEWPEAEAELERALAAGVDTPSLHAEHGRVLGELYHRASRDARRASSDKGWLAREEALLQARFLVPALVELARSPGEGILEARFALDRRDYRGAEERATRVAARTPWLFEAHEVAGDAAYAAGIADFDRGEYDAARVGLERATGAYARGGATARSDASMAEAEAEAWLARAEIDFRQGVSPRAALEQALAGVERAVTAEPGRATAYTTKAYVLLRWYRTPALRAGAERDLLGRLDAAAARATELAPRDANAWDALANAHVYGGLDARRRGEDPMPWWDGALGELDRALALQPAHPWAVNDAGVVHRQRGSRLLETGADPMVEYRAALASYRRAVELDPEYVFALSNEADIQMAMADVLAEHGEDPADAVAGAIAAGERCLAVDGKLYAVLDTMAIAKLVRASYLIDAGADPAADIAEARRLLDRAFAVRPGNMTVWVFRAVAATLEARSVVEQPPAAIRAIAQGRAAVDAARRLGECAPCDAQAAELDLVEASVQAEKTIPLRRAVEDARRALAFDGENEDARLALAEAELLSAQAGGGAAALADGLAAVGSALAQNPRLARAHAIRAALLIAQATATRDAAEARRLAGEARDEGARAFALNPLLRRRWGAELAP